MRHTGRPQVVIVDDQAGFREAARRLLEARGYEVVAEAGSAATALDAVEQHQPTAVLLDVRLGDHDGFAVCGELTRLRPDLAVLLASDAQYEDFTDLIAACGARGFVRKSRLARSISASSGRRSEWARDLGVDAEGATAVVVPTP